MPKIMVEFCMRDSANFKSDLHHFSKLFPQISYFEWKNSYELSFIMIEKNCCTILENVVKFWIFQERQKLG